MLSRKNLQSNQLFAEDSLEERFRTALDREVEACAQTDGCVRNAILAEATPESVAGVLASLLTGAPILLASQGWGRWSWESYSRVEHAPVKSEAVLIRTGGSSGEPKFAVHSWRSLEASAIHLWEHLGKNPMSARLDLPLHHVSGWMPVMRALVSGGQVASSKQTDWAGVPGLRLGSVVPTTLYRALEDPRKRRFLQEADRVFAGGAAFSGDLLQEARRHSIPLCPVYGMTETAAMIAAQEPQDFLAGKDLTLSALPGNRISVDPENQVLIESDQLFEGYWGRTMRASKPWGTGDLGEVDQGGRLILWGRRGRFVASGGETVSLEKIESTAIQLEGVAEAYATAYADAEWGERVVLFLAAKGQRARDWRAELKGILDPHEVPAQVRVLEEIPRNGAGKVDPDRLFG